MSVSLKKTLPPTACVPQRCEKPTNQEPKKAVSLKKEGVPTLCKTPLEHKLDSLAANNMVKLDRTKLKK